ncbi:MAG: aspartate aminotransferase family protein [Candidatus Hydrogenedentes bacterium]|nr:aspartate aminotransferase family protein [Candidatus Hydrogenedentota bacterium]
MSMTIPEIGMSRDEIMIEMSKARERDARWEEGKIFSLVFHLSDEHTEFLKEVYTSFFHENGLNPFAFQSLKKFESEVVRMVANLLNGDDGVVGCMTSGGTESILLAMKTYRDYIRNRRRDRFFIPEVIVPDTAHVAFEKAGEYFDIKIVHAPVDSEGRVDVDAVERRITSKTVAVVGSAPNYPCGAVDPIIELGKLAQRYNLLLHVDACIGGMVLPWWEKLGKEVPLFDFRVPGVTSISVDIHKYGYSAKGASVILYKSIEFMREQIFVYVNWPGGIYMSPGMLGTRPGGAIASAWATLMSIGEKGYMDNSKLLIDTVERFQEGIRSIPGLDIVGNPCGPVFAYYSTDKNLNIYAVADVMEEKGWHIDRQQKPPSIHQMINPTHKDIVERYIEDLRDSVEKVRGNRDIGRYSKAPTYGMLANIPARALVEKEVRKMVEKIFTGEFDMEKFGERVDGNRVLKILREMLSKLRIKK